MAAGETLFAISKQYNVEIEDIQKLNNMNDVALSLGQVLIIKEDDSAVEKVVEVPSVEVPEGGYTVLPGETLFAISRKFSVSVDDLVKWNKLENTSLQEGQKLIVKEGTPTKKQAEVKVDKQEETVKVEEIRCYVKVK